MILKYTKAVLYLRTKYSFIIRGERATSVNSEINDDYYLTDNVEEVIELIVKQELETKHQDIFRLFRVVSTTAGR